MTEDYKLTPTLRLLGKQLSDSLGSAPQERADFWEELLDRLEEAERRTRVERARRHNHIVDS